jgi:hypothetical protein
MNAAISRLLVSLAVLLATTSTAFAADDDALIRLMIQKGVAYLKSTQQAPDGTWTHSAHVMGPTALAGLTMIECGVSKEDPAVQKALAYVRDAATGKNNAPGADQTYDIALSILFLDRYGSKRDIQVIESLTVRLMAGQNSQGGWTYDCPTVAPDEMLRLQENMLQTGDRPRDTKKRATLEELPPQIRDQLKQIGAVQPLGRVVGFGPGDNSNTQFATLGLWVGRRHGLPVEQALARIEQRYRLSQNNLDGGWGYIANGVSPSKDTMTCAGLLGLAVAYGYALEKEERQSENGSKKPSKQPGDLTQDRAVRFALMALGKVVGTPLGAPQITPAPGGALNLSLAPVGPGPMQPLAIPPMNYYLLWSIERVAMAFDLQKIGGKDWFRWGATLLARSQQPDGSWAGQYSAGGADTCFALLFLSRSNLAQDLTASLRGRVHDPGEARMHAKESDPRARMAETKPALNVDLKMPTNFAAPELDPATPAGKLSQELVKATTQEQAAVLAKLRDSKGVVFTEALAGAIPHLSSGAKSKARDALAERMTRMSPATLRDKFKEPDPEIRRAAILAAAMSEDKSFVPDILTLLSDPSPTVWHAVPVALKLLSGQDFGPKVNASPAEREQARTRWDEWWRKSNTK